MNVAQPRMDAYISAKILSAPTSVNVSLDTSWKLIEKPARKVFGIF